MSQDMINQLDILDSLSIPDLSYPETWLVYSQLTGSIEPSISSLRNEVQPHLKSTIRPGVGLRLDTPHIFYSPANFDPKTLIINI